MSIVSVFVVLVCIAVVVGPIALCIWIAASDAKDRRECTQEALAVILHTGSSQSSYIDQSGHRRRGTKSYSATVAYNLGGTYYTETISGKKDLAESRIIPILYKPNDPGFAMINGKAYPQVRQSMEALDRKQRGMYINDPAQGASVFVQMYCPKCGIFFADGTHYCNSCGEFLHRMS